MRQMPVRIGDGRGFEHVFRRELRNVSARNVDNTVDVDPADMDTLGTEIAGQRVSR